MKRKQRYVLNKDTSVSLSRPYLRLAQILLFFGILMTGVFMVCTAVGSFTGTVKETLLKNCEALSVNISEAYEAEQSIDGSNTRMLLDNAGSEYRYLVSVYDIDGRRIYPEGAEALSSTIMSYTRTNDYLEFGYFTEDAEDLQLCCAIRFHSEDANGKPVWFYLKVINDAAGVASYTKMLAVTLVVGLLVSTLLFMLLFQFVAKRLDRDFDKINSVVRKYAEGDFTARVDLPEHTQLYPFGNTLNHMAEFIEQNETTRKNFVANVSHELRTPMTTIGGFADCILDGTIPPEQHGRYVRIISEEIHRLRTLVNSMLNLSKFEAGEMQLRLSNFDAAGVLIKTVLMFERRISEKKVDVEGLEDAELTVRADEDLIFQVLYNLVENAVKFVNDGGVITFSLRAEDGVAFITVRNTGEGLSDDELPKVFDRFYKTDTSRSKDKTGLGLGLSIARKIVHLHQGHIVVKSVKGEYTSFEVQIPQKSTQ